MTGRTSFAKLTEAMSADRRQSVRHETARLEAEMRLQEGRRAPELPQAGMAED